MKKLKLSGKDIRKTGIKEDRAISITKNVLEYHYKQLRKKEALEIVKKIIKNPDKYANHPELGQIAKALRKAPKSASKSVNLSKVKPYSIYGEEHIEQGALQQMDTAMRLPISIKGSLMPDAHQGYGLPIGGVVATKNAVIPYGVGMDIGCRMCMSIYDLGKDFIRSNADKLEKILNEHTRFGRSEFQEKKEHPVIDREEFKEISFLKSLQKKAYDQLGSSGHGNHFVDFGILEVKEAIPEKNLEPGKYFAILSHSGSRGSGAEIARHYTKIASQVCELPKGAKSLAWLDLSTQEGEEYWKAMNWAGDYSAANHHFIHDKLSKALGETPISRIENHHNFAWKEQQANGETWIVHRKGATPATKDVLGVIPGSMASPAYVVKGLGNEQSLNSAAHGAGRLMSRSEAKKRFSQNQLKDYLQVKGVTLLSAGIDEAPMAYKDINTVMSLQDDLVKKIAIFEPKIVKMG